MNNFIRSHYSDGLLYLPSHRCFTFSLSPSEKNIRSLIECTEHLKRLCNLVGLDVQVRFLEITPFSCYFCTECECKSFDFRYVRFLIQVQNSGCQITIQKCMLLLEIKHFNISCTWFLLIISSPWPMLRTSIVTQSIQDCNQSFDAHLLRVNDGAGVQLTVAYVQTVLIRWCTTSLGGKRQVLS